jgi:hypothetical protein
MLPPPEESRRHQRHLIKIRLTATMELCKVGMIPLTHTHIYLKSYGFLLRDGTK